VLFLNPGGDRGEPVKGPAPRQAVLSTTGTPYLISHAKRNLFQRETGTQKNSPPFTTVFKKEDKISSSPAILTSPSTPERRWRPPSSPAPFKPLESTPNRVPSRNKFSRNTLFSQAVSRYASSVKPSCSRFLRRMPIPNASPSTSPIYLFLSEVTLDKHRKFQLLLLACWKICPLRPLNLPHRCLVPSPSHPLYHSVIKEVVFRLSSSSPLRRVVYSQNSIGHMTPGVLPLVPFFLFFLKDPIFKLVRLPFVPLSFPYLPPLALLPPNIRFVFLQANPP